MEIQDDFFALGDAVFYDCKQYRYRLGRNWADVDLGTVLFVMLNPSTADEHVNDPTVKRCMNYARGWGYSTLLVGNIFALRSTDPKALYTHEDPVGPDNDKHLLEMYNEADITVAAGARTAN